MASASSLADTEEKCNGMKLARLLIDGGTETLRRTFNSIHPPASLQAVLHTNQPLLNSLRKKRVLFHSQWDKLYPPGGAAPDSKTFDITLLFVLLRNICGLTPPATGWDALPPAADISQEANLARIKYYRNEVHGHVTSTGVSEADFQLYWNGISGALKALGADKVVIDHLKSSPIGANDYIALLTEFSSDMKEKMQKVDTNVETIKEVVCDVKEKVQKVDAVYEEICELKAEVEKQSAAKQVSLIQTLSKCSFVQHTETLANDQYQKGTRKWILDEIEKFYTNPEDRSRALVITALPGVGKSVLAAVACRNAKKKGRLGVCYFIQHSNSQRNNPRVIIETVARQLCDSVEGFSEKLHERLSSLKDVRKNLDEMNLETLISTLLEEPLSAMPNWSLEHTFVIVIDALDEIEPRTREEFIRVLFRKLTALPKWIKFVITSRPTKQLSAQFSHVTVVDIDIADSNNTEDIRSYLSEKLKSLYSEEHIEELETTTAKLTERSQGIFLFAHFAIESAKERNLSLSDTSELFPKGISSVYEEYLARSQTELNLEEEKFMNFLEGIVAAQAPLPQPLVLQILGIGKESRQQQKIARKALSSLSLLFPEDQKCISTFHKSLADWLTMAESEDEGHDFSVKVADGHRVLAEHCLKVLRAVKNHKSLPPELSDSENYALTFGFHHMLEAGGYEEQLGQFVQDLELLAAVWVARRKATSIHPMDRKYDLIKDLKRISDCSSLPDDNLLYLCKMMKAMFVDTDCPQFVLQCAAYCPPSTGFNSKATTLLDSPKYKDCVWMEKQEIYSFEENQHVESCHPGEHTVICVCTRDRKHYTIVLLDIEGGRQLAEEGLGHLKYENLVQISVSDKHVVVWQCFGQQLQLRDVRTLQTQRTFELEVRLLSCCFLPGNKLAVGCWNGTVRVWDVESGVVETTLQCPSGPPVYCTASAAGQLLTVEGRGFQPKQLVLWQSLKSPEPVQLDTDVYWAPGQTHVCQDGRFVAYLCRDQQHGIFSVIRLFDLTTAQLRECFRFFFLSVPQGLLFIDDTHILIDQCYHELKVWSISDGSFQDVPSEEFCVFHKGTRECVAISREDHRTLYKLTFHNLK